MPTNTEVVQQVFSGINAQDLDAMRAVWAPDVVERFPDKTCRGQEELSAYFAGLFAALPDFRMEIVNTIEDGETVYARWRTTGTHTGGRFNGIDPTGKVIAFEGMDEFTIRDGKVAANFVVFDQMEVGRQLGLLPPDGSPPDRALKAAFNAKTKIADLIRERRAGGSSGGGGVTADSARGEQRADRVRGEPARLGERLEHQRGVGDRHA